MNEMTISQAIRKVKDLKGRIAKHQGYAASSVHYEVKNPPAYDFAAELRTVETMNVELLKLQTAIAVANATTSVEWNGGKVKLTWAIKRLEEIKGSIKWYETLGVTSQTDSVTESWEYQNDASGTLQRVRIEKPIKCDLPEAKRNETVQKLQDEFNRLNDVVETINHRTSVSLEG